MGIKKLNEFPEASGVNLTSDDIFLMMDDPSGLSQTKKVSLSALASFIGTGGGGGGTLPVTCALGTGSGNMPTDAGSCDIITATANGDTLVQNPTSPTDGKTLRWKLSQDGAGGHTWTLDTKFNIPSSASNPLPWSTAANKTDLLAATYDAGRDKWDIIAFVPGY